MVTHCDVDLLAGQRTETRGKAGRAAVVLLLVTMMLFVGAFAVDELSSFLLFLGFRGEDMMAVKAFDFLDAPEKMDRGNQEAESADFNCSLSAGNSTHFKNLYIILNKESLDMCTLGGLVGYGTRL